MIAIGLREDKNLEWDKRAIPVEVDKEVVFMSDLDLIKNRVYDCYNPITNRSLDTLKCVSLMKVLQYDLESTSDYSYAHFAISALHTELDPSMLSNLIDSYIDRNSENIDDDEKFDLWSVAFSASSTVEGAKIFYDKYGALDKHTKFEKLNEVLLISQQYLARNETSGAVRSSVNKVIDTCKKSPEGIPVGCAYFNYLKVTSALENEYDISAYILRKTLSERNPYTVVVLLDEMSYMCEDLGHVCDDLQNNAEFRAILLEGSTDNKYSASDRAMFRASADNDFS